MSVAQTHTRAWDARPRAFGWAPGAVTEVVLLVADDRLAALQAAAESKGLTTGTLTRRILDEYLSAGPG